VLTLNPGSSSMKVSLVDDGTGVGWAAWTWRIATSAGRTRSAAGPMWTRPVRGFGEVMAGLTFSSVPPRSCATRERR